MLSEAISALDQLGQSRHEPGRVSQARGRHLSTVPERRDLA